MDPADPTGRIERVIDANANRAREALRVMEDLARFILDDANLTERTKSMRHDLVAQLERAGLGHARLAAARDVKSDCGTDITTDGERQRAGLAEIAAAAGGRLAEALRTLEECFKARVGNEVGNGAGDGAAVFESLRYRAYDVDKALAQRLPQMIERQWRLCVLVSERLCTHCPWQEVVIAALAAGADCVQLREKGLSDADLLQRARVLVGLAHDVGADVVINDRADIALAAGADALHLGQVDLPLDEARRIVGSRVRVGVSITRVSQGHAAVEGGGGGGADYLGVGPMFPTTSKADLVTKGPQLLAEVLDDEVLGGKPHLAIGGISIENVDQLVEVGCRGIAVSSAVCSATDPGAACAALLERLPPVEVAVDESVEEPAAETGGD
jgi:thiamine-phosphate pyrophosphorylase